MISSAVTRMNISVTHSQKSCMENIKTIGSSSRDPGLVSNDITNIEKRINLRPIITNVVLSSGWGFMSSGKEQ